MLSCTIDDVGLYPKAPHEEGLASLKEKLDNRKNKEVTVETFVESADIVLKITIFSS